MVTDGDFILEQQTLQPNTTAIDADTHLAKIVSEAVVIIDDNDRFLLLLPLTDRNPSIIAIYSNRRCRMSQSLPS